MKKEIEVAALYQKIYDNEKIELFVPYRIIIGKTDDTGLKFYDTLSNTVYFSLDNYSDSGNYFGFNEPKTLREIKKMFPDMKLLDAIYAYLKKLKENAYYYSLETGGIDDFRLKSLPVEEFTKTYDVKVNYNCLPGKIEDVDFDKIEEIFKSSKLEENSIQQEETEEKLENEIELEEMELPSIIDVYNEIKNIFYVKMNRLKKF